MPLKDRLDRGFDHEKTVDPVEVERFEALAREWWKPAGKFAVIHKFNPVRRDYINGKIAHHFGCDDTNQGRLAGLEILDVGCGAGLLCEPLAGCGASVVGIDAAAKNIEIARWHAAGCGLEIDYRQALASHLRSSGEQFDVVLNTEVIEHVADPEQLMADCCSLVRPGGMLVVTTLNRTIRSFFLAIVGAEYVLGWLPKGTHDWQRFVRPIELAAMLGPNRLETTEIVGVTFNPLVRRWHLSSDTSVNYNLLAIKSP